MKIRPLQDRVLVKRVESETKQGGLYIPDSAQEKPQQGEVVAVGEGKRTDEGERVGLDVKIGDRILFGKYSGAEFKEAGVEYLMLREDEILRVIGGGTTRGIASVGLPGDGGTDTD